MLIGSVKTNLGHSEAASGLTSIIKVTLALEKGRIPPTIGLKNLNPKIRPAWNMDVVTSLVPWPTSNTRRASINSFGYGGANAHCILEAASDHVSPKPRLPGSTVLRASERLQIVPICAASTQSLREQMAKLVRAPDTNRRFWNTLRGLCRKASFHATRDYIIIKESDFSSNLASKYPTPGAIANANPLPLAYVFTGQGAQWQGMGRQLLQFARFRSTIQILDECLKSLPDSPPWTLIGTLSSLTPMILIVDHWCKMSFKVTATKIAWTACHAARLFVRLFRWPLLTYFPRGGFVLRLLSGILPVCVPQL